MKKHFSRQIDHRTFAFTRIALTGQMPWYQVRLNDADQNLSFWMKREGEGQWKIQPQLLPEDILSQEQAFAKVIREQEAKTLYYA